MPSPSLHQVDPQKIKKIDEQSGKSKLAGWPVIMPSQHVQAMQQTLGETGCLKEQKFVPAIRPSVAFDQRRHVDFRKRPFG